MKKNIFLCLICFLILSNITINAADFKKPKDKYGYVLGYQVGLEIKSERIHLKSFFKGFYNALSENPNYLEIEKEKRSKKKSFSIGFDAGSLYKKRGIDLLINFKLYEQGINDAIKGKKSSVTASKRQVLKEFNKEIIANQVKAFRRISRFNLNLGKNFLRKNRRKAGVKVLRYGLQYKVLQEGMGERPTMSDRVTVHYEGRLLNGKVFDSSYQRKNPASFPLRGVIRGWGIAVTKMRVGATWMLYIPAYLAYGERGAGKDIGPNETLIFKINLIAVHKR